MTPMSKTAAIREARSRVLLARMGRGWALYRPYRWDEPRGALTGGHETGWYSAKSEYTRAVASGALHLMGFSGEQAEEAVLSLAEYHGYTTITEIVNRAPRDR